MRHGLIAGIAAIAIALAMGALLATWDGGSGPNSAGLSTREPMQEGRAATTTDPNGPMRPNHNEPATPTPR
ncbi:hypothetical protein [Flaviflagellibacter deserti]|jgi:hypothetical protein|uniref:Uncharacterized protein n=1 Tax=Flaviflagellibacter deserti TaxID=2267266 RepID=A0ABV9Z4M3_9HYPH